jgi:hypothetical protein
MKRSILVVFSDIHSGHKFGLMNPEVKLPDIDTGGSELYTPSTTAAQRLLWENYQADMRKVKELAQDDPVHIIVNGDVTQGNKHGKELVTTRLVDQVTIAVANLEGWLQLPGLKTVRISLGTEAHELEESSTPYLVTAQLKAMRPRVDIKVVAHGISSIDGYLVDYAHHGPTAGSNAWVKGNSARLYLRDLMMLEIFQGNPPANLVVRSDVHNFVIERLYLDTEAGNFDSAIVVTPPYCLPGAYARKAARSVYQITVGMIVVEIYEGGLSKIHKLTKTFDIRTKEVL